jgi:hypothetical protein
LLAKVVNDDAGNQDERGALQFFASKPAPTEKQKRAKRTMGHSWPSAANPAFGQCGLTGRFQIKSKARRPYSRPDRCGVRVPPVGAGLLAKVVNDDAGNQDERGALQFFAGKPAPTEKQKRAKRMMGHPWSSAANPASCQRGLTGRFQIKSKARRPYSRPDRCGVRVPPVGAGLPAMVVNDDAGNQDERGALRFFASKPAPTEKQKRAKRMMGHPWSSAANPASCQRGLTGRLQIKSKARRPYSRPDRCGVRVPPVGAGLLAKVVNDDAGNLDDRGALQFFAGKPAPTEKQKRRQRTEPRRGAECWGKSVLVTFARFKSDPL